MSADPEKKRPSKTVQIGCALIFMIVGFVGFQQVKPTYLSRKPGEDFNVWEAVADGAVIGGFAGLGFWLGTLPERVRRR